MRRLYFMFLALFGVMTVVMAKPVTEEEARKKAEAFLNAKGSMIAGKAIAPTSPYRAARKKQQTDASYYVFNATNNGGFVIVSGDDSTDEILGYAETGNFDIQNLPSNVAAWLQGYADQIEALDGTTTTRQVTPKKVSTHAAIAPLVKTKWNQGAFSATGNAYNYQTPLVTNSYSGEKVHGVTGCVATAMAQVMNYHQWPVEVGAIEEYTYNYSGTPVSVEALPATTFDWKNMLNEYNGSEAPTDPTAIAISTLMRYCGQAVGMAYGEDGQSAAYSGNAAKALTDLFGYDDAVRFVNRSDYTISTWDELIYNELSANRPVYYDGQSSGGGHAFVCDGYDGQGLYHINWGWGGWCDGYFKLSVMNPGSSDGIGASASSDGYSMGQGAIIGVRPDDGIAEAVKMTAENFHIENGEFVFSIYNGTTKTNVFDYAIGKLETDGSFTYLYANESWGNQELEPYYGFNISIPTNFLSLEPGTHRLVPISKATAETVWYNSNKNPEEYLEVVVDENGTIVSSTVYPPTSENIIDLKATMEFPNPPYTGIEQEVVVTIQNDGSEFYGVLYLFDKNNDSKPISYGGLTIEEGATDKISLSFTPTTAGTYELKITTDAEGTNVIGTASLEILAAPEGKVEFEAISKQLVKGTDITWSVTLKNVGNAASVHPILVDLWERTERPDLGEGSYSWNFVEEKELSKIIETESTETLEFSFANLKKGQYQLELYYYTGEKLEDGRYIVDSFDDVRTEFTYEPYTLNITNNLSETLVLPFEALIPEGVTAYTLSYVEEKDAILATEITTATLPANRPVLVAADKAGDYVFVSQEEKLSTNPSNPSTYGMLTGVYEATTAPAGSYQLTSSDGNPAFAVGQTTTIEANRAYLTINNEDARETLIVYFDENSIPELPTGINSVNRIMEDGDIYTLQGVKVTGALKRGIYIKNGVKFVVK